MTLENKVILITGGEGALGSEMARGLIKEGAIIGIVGINEERLQSVKAELKSIGEAEAFNCNVLKEDQLEDLCTKVVEKYGRIDGLINAAGGNMAGATIGPDGHFYDLVTDDLNKVMQLNVQGTMLPTKVISKVMIKQKQGVILNISSMAASRPLTRVVGYAASKAAIDNFTKWMAVELATKYSPDIRINAIAPGFFIGDQNRKLLLNEDGSLTDRAKTIIGHTPMNRFGDPEDLIGSVKFLLSDESKFITGIILPIDGGFSAFSGV